ncbi:transposase (plasmid) [Deinococcus radiomollis]|uniref:transposase n=1 Tax=Deinococcus radiomollis TaxID=468916 RepID=UPI003891825F
MLDDAKCFKVVRAHRWSEGLRCPHCGADQITRQGRDERQQARQRYRCLAYLHKFGDLTGTVFTGHHVCGPLGCA